jgi:hypothetical protein
VLGIWGWAFGDPGVAAGGLALEDPAGLEALASYDVTGFDRLLDNEPPPDLDRVWLPFGTALAAVPPPPRLLPPADEPETPSVDLGRSLLESIENEPRFFPGLMNVLLFPATFTMEGLAWLLLPRSITFNGQTILDQDAARGDLGSIFVRVFVEKEINFLAGLSGSYVSTINVELGLQDYDHQRYDRLQSRVIFDSVKKAYKERYHVPAMDLDTLINALSTGEWVDFLIVPAVVSGYAARFGIDRKWQPCEDLKVQIHVVKAERFYKFAIEKHGGEIGAIAVNLFKLPVSVIFQADRGAHSFVDPTFIGIGTDLGVVLTAIESDRFGR